jgi:hypothetical protein
VVGDVSPLSGDRRCAFTDGAFVGHQVLVNVGFGVARARLANLVHDGLLVIASRDAYVGAVTSLARVGPLGSVTGLSKLVQVQARDLVIGEGSAVLTLRWQATGPGGAIFPVLDADIRLVPAGDRAVMLRLDGAYRPPLGAAGAGLDRAVLHRVATATVQDFLGRIAEAIADPAAPAPGQGAAGAAPELPGPPAAGAS